MTENWQIGCWYGKKSCHICCQKKTPCKPISMGFFCYLQPTLLIYSRFPGVENFSNSPMVTQLISERTETGPDPCDSKIPLFYPLSCFPEKVTMEGIPSLSGRIYRMVSEAHEVPSVHHCKYLPTDDGKNLPTQIQRSQILQSQQTQGPSLSRHSEHHTQCHLLTPHSQHSPRHTHQLHLLNKAQQQG